MKIAALTKFSTAILFASSFSIQAADKYWMGSDCLSSNWSSQCWSATQGGVSDGTGQPQAGDDVYHLGATEVHYYNNAAFAPELNSLNINYSNSGIYTAFYQVGNLASKNETVGLTGHGQHIQQSGTNTVSDTLTLGKQSNAIYDPIHNYYSSISSTYGLYDGTLSASNEIIGDAGSGYFSQQGGNNAVSGTLTVGKQATPIYDPVNNYYYYLDSGRYYLSAGVLTAHNEVIGDAGSGYFNQSGGTNTVSDTLTVGKQSNVGTGYSLSASYSLNAGQLSANNEIIGDAGDGSFYQSGGTNTVSDTLTLGKRRTAVNTYYSASYGSYNLSAGQLNAGNEVIGDAGSGYFSQSGGVNTVIGTLTVGKQPNVFYDPFYNYYYSIGSGSYSLSDGALTAHDEVIGDAGLGYFNQSGGTNTVSGTLTVGKQAGSGYNYYYYSNSSYSLSAGLLAASNEVIGDAGSGTFTQGQDNFGYGTSNSTNSVSNTLTVGKQTGSYGVYNLVGGALTALHEVIGDAGNGSFNQSGGTNTVNNTLTVGKQAGARGFYNLFSGTLSAINEVIGDAGSGTFTQGAGAFGYSASNNVSDTLTLGKQAGSNGIYTLLAGALSALQEIIGDAGIGTFNQSGGTNSIGDTLTVAKQAGSEGYYYLVDGTVSDTNAVIGDAGYGGFTQGREANAFYPGPNSNGGTHNVAETLTLGKQASGYGYYYLAEGKLKAKNIVVGDAGQSWFGQGDYYSYALSKATNTVSETLTVGRQAGGLGEYHFYAGSLIAANEVIGDAGIGQFTQGEGNFGYGATNSVSGTLTLGKQVGSNGSYSLIAGNLSAQHEVIGDAGSGTFFQQGGSNTVTDSLVVGKQASGQGSYNLVNGTLNTVNEVIGDAGSGTFSQGSYSGHSSIHNVSNTLTVGRQSGSRGAYNLLSGKLTAANEIIGAEGEAVFTQGEGNFGYTATNSVSNTLTVGQQAGSHGTYNLIAGALTALREIVGDAGTGIFDQNGGTNTVNSTLTLGQQVSGNGSYILSKGSLTATDEIIGDAGNGSLTQGNGNFGYGTTNNVSGTLTLGKQAGSNGIYNLVAGALNTLNTVVGDAGNGSFSQTGGTHTVGDTLTLGKQAGAHGDYGLYGGTLTAVNEVIGDAGDGSFVHRATNFGDGNGPTYPINNVSGTLTLGNQAGGSGSYYLHSGELNTHDTVVGNAGTGLLNQLGGTHAVAGTLTLGKQTGGKGTYNLLGGVLSAANQVVGDAGTGIVNQFAGTNVVDLLTFGKQSSGVGAYNLKGGSLTVGNIDKGAGTGTLLISGGALNFGAGAHVVDVDTLTVSGQGVINLADSAITTFQNDVTHNGQAINLGVGSNAIFNAGFNGAGPFTGAGTATFNGVFNPGNSPALFSVAGNMVLGESSKSIMEVAGSDRGLQYDAVNVGNGLTLNGELQIQFLNGFAPLLGSSFDLFDAETLYGQFDSVTLIGLGQGLGWKLDYLTDAIGTLDIVRLSVISSVPLPGSIWLMQFALFSLVAVRRARNSRR